MKEGLIQIDEISENKLVETASQEIENAAVTLERIEHSLISSVKHNMEKSQRYSLQEYDLVIQKLRDISTLLYDLSEKEPSRSVNSKTMAGKLRLEYCRMRFFPNEALEERKIESEPVSIDLFNPLESSDSNF